MLVVLVNMVMITFVGAGEKFGFHQEDTGRQLYQRLQVCNLKLHKSVNFALRFIFGTDLCHKGYKLRVLHLTSVNRPAERHPVVHAASMRYIIFPRLIIQY